MDKKTEIYNKYTSRDFRSILSIHRIYIIGLVAHILFLLLFIFLGVKELVIYNIFSPLLYLFCFYLNKKGEYSIAGTLAIFEVTAHGVIAVWFLGWQSGFHYYLLLSFFAIFFILKISFLKKTLFSLLLSAIYISFYSITYNYTPKYIINAALLKYISTFNIMLALMVIILFCYLYIYLVDLTEKWMKRNEIKLKEMNASKDKLFSIISHDLKDPLNSSLGFSNLLSTEYEEIDDDTRKEYISIIYNSQKKLLNLIDDLLIWSKSQSENIKPKPKIFELNKVVDDVLKLFENNLKEKRINAKSNVSLSSKVYADEDMIKTILRNLISNSIKFTYPEGQIIVSEKVNHDNIEISVIDDGIGIKSENIKDIFSIDKNNISIGTNNEKGTGLGLVICKEFVEINGGEISVNSEPGKETRFKFTLPTSK